MHDNACNDACVHVKRRRASQTHSRDMETLYEPQVDFASTCPFTVVIRVCMHSNLRLYAFYIFVHVFFLQKNREKYRQKVVSFFIIGKFLFIRKRNKTIWLINCTTLYPFSVINLTVSCPMGHVSTISKKIYM